MGAPACSNARCASRGPRQLSPITEADVQMAVRKGNKVDAIKLYREMTGCGIEEALDVVEDMASRLHPDA
jgi:ribosomal protein L7/L12